MCPESGNVVWSKTDETVEPGVPDSSYGSGSQEQRDLQSHGLMEKNNARLPYREMPSSGSGEIRLEKVMWKPSGSTQMIIIAPERAFGPINSARFLCSTARAFASESAWHTGLSQKRSKEESQNDENIIPSHCLMA